MGSTAVLFTWHLYITMQCGDVHPNPGPSSGNQSLAESSFTSDIHDPSNSLLSEFLSSKYLSLVHYNVQSIFTKLDVISSELKDFDILAFTETWLSDSVETDSLAIAPFNLPERKDRETDAHGGVLLYVKSDIHYVRRHDLELNRLENIWIELSIKGKTVLIGLFYRPPNADITYSDLIEDSINLASDTGVNDIIVTGDFNYNSLNQQSLRKINSISQQFNLNQVIVEPTHYTENSSSIIDLLFVSDTSLTVASGVTDPFLNQETRFHCPIYGIFNLPRPKRSTFKRKMHMFQHGDYTKLREDILAADWNECFNEDISIYTDLFTKKLLTISENCIPTKIVTVRPNDPPWLNNNIRRKIRARKRAFRKARRTQNPLHWDKFKKLRNQTVRDIRKVKQEYYDSLANKLASPKP